MIVVWLASGLLGGSQQEQYGGGWAPRRRPKRVSVEREEQEAVARVEAQRQAEEALAAFDAAEKAAYLKRLDGLVAMFSRPVVYIDPQAVAAQAVAALVSELEREFDAYIATLEFERDEEDALIAILLAA